MNAIHTCWSKPMIYGHGTFFAEDFELLTTAISALKWREKNGRIKLVTDRVGYKYYSTLNITDIWDEVSTALDDMPDTINPVMFWAAGKICALKNEDVPTASLDTDFIVWNSLDFENFADLTVIHSEDITPNVYPNPDGFNMREGYVFDPAWDTGARPFNAAFTVIKNAELKNAYISEAIRFMENALDGDNLTYMVFAEQRLLAMTAKSMGIQTTELSTIERLFGDGEKNFTHVWGMKQQMREMPHLRASFCRRCADRLKRDFPDYARRLSELDELAEYFK